MLRLVLLLVLAFAVMRSPMQNGDVDRRRNRDG